MEGEWNGSGSFHDSLSDPSLLDYEEDSDFSEWYSMEGSARITELSRQLRTFLNYKSLVIQLRFSRDKKENDVPKEEQVMMLQGDLHAFSTQYVTLLKMIGAENKPVMKKILILMERVNAHKRESDITLFRELKKLGGDIWKILHALSECELHHYPQLLKLAIKIAATLCGAESAFFWIFTRFYWELEQSYRQLEEELAGLLGENEGEQVKASEKMDTRKTREGVNLLERPRKKRL